MWKRLRKRCRGLYGATTTYRGLFLRGPRAGAGAPPSGVAPPERGGPAEGGRLGGRESLRRSALVADRLRGGGPVVADRGGIEGTGGTLSPPKRGELLRIDLLGDAVAARGGGTMAGGASTLSPLLIHRLSFSS